MLILTKFYERIAEAIRLKIAELSIKITTSAYQYLHFKHNLKLFISNITMIVYECLNTRLVIIITNINNDFKGLQNE